MTTRLEVTRELRRHGWDVTLLVQGPAGIRNVDGVEVLCVPRPKLYFVGYFLFHISVLRFLAEEWTNIDVLLFHSASAPWLLPLRLLRRFTGKQKPLLVMDTRDLVPNRKNLRARLRILFIRMAHGLANHWADGQTAITKSMAELVNIPRSRLWGIWPSGVNIERFAQARSRRFWPSNEDPVQMIYVGALYRERNLLPLCQAVEEANASGMDFYLSILGRGPERAALQAFASKGDGRIRIPAPVPHWEIPALLANAHIGVTSLPSPDNDKFAASSPIKLFEYMAAGLPILSTRNPCYVEVVGHGSYAFWAVSDRPESLLMAIRKVWKSKPTLRGKGEEAFADAERWTWEQAAFRLAMAIEARI